MQEAKALRLDKEIRPSGGVSLRQFGWKLALSYTVITLAALLTTVLVVGILILPRLFSAGETLSSESAAEWDERIQEAVIPALRPILSKPPVDALLAAATLGRIEEKIERRDVFTVGNIQFSAETSTDAGIVVLDRDGRVLAHSEHSFLPTVEVGRPIDGLPWPELEENLGAALSGELNPERLYTFLPEEDSLISVIPVYGSQEEPSTLLGIVISTIRAVPSQAAISSQIFRFVGRFVVLFFAGIALLGVTFGFLTANRMVRRFDRVSAAAASWSEGDFSKLVMDRGSDEIGELARRLNSMALQLNELLENREELAISKERNRLARDLHDSAKQQAFGASAQLAAALAVYEQDPAATLTHIQQAQKLVDRVRRELTSLILQLRPLDLDEGGLPTALQAHAGEWAHQNELHMEFEVQGGRSLSLEAEKMLFRIAQEALANIARHARAERVEIGLQYGEDGVRLSIQDDGIGFDPAAVSGGLGLQSIRERAEQAEARLELDSTPGGGTIVTVLLDHV